jgi:hypothetical protein
MTRPNPCRQIDASDLSAWRALEQFRHFAVKLSVSNRISYFVRSRFFQKFGGNRFVRFRLKFERL